MTNTSAIKSLRLVHVTQSTEIWNTHRHRHNRLNSHCPVHLR